MFKIPNWEDDVPKSKITFGKTTKAKKKKEEGPQKGIKNQEKNNKSPVKGKNRFRKDKKENNSRFVNKSEIKFNGSNKINKQNGYKSKFNTKKHEQNESNKGENRNNFQLNDQPSKNLVSKKNKKLRKRKLEALAANVENNTQAEVHGKKQLQPDKNTPSKAKKRKHVDENQEGSILFQTPQKKKKKVIQSDAINNVNIAYKESKVTQKKEKLRQMLKMESSRSNINISGDNLRQRMLERLKAAQFRFLNEKLYTTSGSEAQKLFQTDPEAFQTYHQGYQLQVKKWPVNPLDLIVKRISKMPKTHIIADMGCGEAALAKRVQQEVRSFDLVASAPGVQACDMAHTPLQPGAADAAVYCLALMGTELTQYLVEANRVLKVGGHLLIAEVESRFNQVEKFTEDVQKLGFKLKNLDKSHQVFFFMEFTKVRDPPAKKSKLPTLHLKPCFYKRR